MGHRDDRPGRARDEVVAARLRLIRKERYGEGGAQEVAAQLGLPLRTWLPYGGGAAIPGVVILAYLKLTGVDPLWLLNGVGVRYRAERERAGAGRREGAS